MQTVMIAWLFAPTDWQQQTKPESFLVVCYPKRIVFRRVICLCSSFLLVFGAQEMPRRRKKRAKNEITQTGGREVKGGMRAEETTRKGCSDFFAWFPVRGKEQVAAKV
jgi:hypothetical protein